MLSNQDLNQNKSSPSISNQFQNNTSQIVNYYINLTQNLNMNNPNYSLMPKPSLMESSNNLSPNNKNSNPNPNQNNANITLLNTFIMTSYINNLQIEANYRKYCEMLSNCNNIIANQNEKITKETINFAKKKRRRKTNSNEKKVENKKIINLAEKNGAQKTNKIEHSIDKEIDEHKQSIVKLNVKSDEKCDKKENNKKINIVSKDKEKLNRNKKINKYKELLQDSFLEQFDKDNHKNDVSIIINNSNYDEINNESKNKNKNQKTKQKKEINSKKKNLNLKNNNSKNGKKTNVLRNRKNNNHHFTQKKKAKSNVKFQATQCIFHGENYQKTNSAIEFMKYNYNYIKEKEEFKKIKDAERQTVRIDLTNLIYNNNYDNNKNNLSDIKKIWSKSMN